MPYDEIYGAFSMVIRDSPDRYVVFNDNSAMCQLYISSEAISDDFRQIIQYSRCTEFDETVVSEYLSRTRCVISRTLIKGVSASNHLCFYTIENQKITEYKKEIGCIDSPSTICSVPAFFDDLYYAISGIPHIMALTGGFDSRLVCSLLCKSKDDLCFISGDNVNSPEIECAHHTAEAGGIQIRDIPMDYPTVTDELLQDLFNYFGSYRTPISTSALRICQFQNKLLQEGYRIIITGDAGDMHKEFWMVQDFPFYWIKRTRLKRFIQSRMEIYNVTKYLGKQMINAYSDMLAEEMSILKDLTRARNAQSYMLFGWQCDWVPISYANTSCKEILSYAPLQELDLARMSYQILPKGKFLNYFERKLTTTANIKMARVPTVYGTTSSSEFVFILRDIVMQMIQYAKQIVRQVSRKVAMKSVFTTEVCTKNLYDKIQSTLLARNAIDWAREKEWLLEDTPNKLPFPLVERIVNLYLINELLKQNENSSIRVE